MIDAAKTGKINKFSDHPGIQERVDKACGGKNGRMPFFFQYSKNGRHQPNNIKGKKKKTYAKINDSTMNRICKAFDDVDRMSFNNALVPFFNYQMLLPNDSYVYNEEAAKQFCELDDATLFALIESASSFADAITSQSGISTNILREYISDSLSDKYQTLEDIYPSIVQYLFTGENAERASHKQSFWRVFGHIAVKYLKANLNSYTVCPKCTKSIPSWATHHECSRSAHGMFLCETCGAWTRRRGPKQTRCDECQQKYREEYFTQYYQNIRRKKHKDEQKEE